MKKQEYERIDLDHVPDDPRAMTITLMIRNRMDGIATALGKARDMIGDLPAAAEEEVSRAIVENLTSGVAAMVMAEAVNRGCKFSPDNYAEFVKDVCVQMQPLFADVERIMGEVTDIVNEATNAGDANA